MSTSSAEDVPTELDWESSGVGPGAEDEGVDPETDCRRLPGVVGGIRGIVDVDGSNLGRKAELISPIPTKKSSVVMLTRHRPQGGEFFYMG